MGKNVNMKLFIYLNKRLHAETENNTSRVIVITHLVKTGFVIPTDNYRVYFLVNFTMNSRKCTTCLVGFDNYIILRNF